MARIRKPKTPARVVKKRPKPASTLAQASRRLLQVLRRRGWSVRLASSSRKLLPPAVAKRYPQLPEDVETFLCSLELCLSPKESVWFLTADDFARKRGPSWRWDDMERLMLEGADGDAAQEAEFRSFWDGHLPVMFALHSDYDYLAVRISDGAVVHGYGPAWEEPDMVARSFKALLSALATEADAARNRWPWSVFVGRGS